VTEGLCDKNFTKVFAFDRADVNTLDREIEKGLRIATDRDVPVVSTQPYATEPFPIWGIAAELRSTYFMPTMSYMIAYALFLKYERLFIYGIDQGPQWMLQFGKPHICHWIGVAIGRGVIIELGWGSLRWSYTLGTDKMPRAFLETEYPGTAEQLTSLIGK